MIRPNWKESDSGKWHLLLIKSSGAHTLMIVIVILLMIFGLVVWLNTVL